MPALIAALLLAPLTAGVVLEVSPTGPYTQIQAAVSAANDGDLVLVHGGTYGSFTVQAKSLTVVADTGATVNLQGGVSVLGLAAGQTVCIIGLHAYGDPDYFSLMPSGLLAQGNLGRVRCEHCQLSAQQTDTDAARIESSPDVSFVACQLLGGPGYGVGGAGARAANSTLTFFDCSVAGGAGLSFGGLADGGSGGEGLAAASSTIFSSGSSFVGGTGGSASFVGIITPQPGYGGAGADLASGSLMRHIQTSFVGGLDGDLLGAAAPTIGGTFTSIPGTLRSMTGSNPVRELNPLGFTFHGAPGEDVYLLVGLEPGLQWDPAHEANFLLASPFRTLRVGTTNASGNLSVNLPLSDLGAGVQSEVFYLQPLFVGAGGAQQLGTPITLAALDQAF